MMQLIIAAIRKFLPWFTMYSWVRCRLRRMRQGCAFVFSNVGISLLVAGASSYWTAIDLWKDDWKFLSENRVLHQNISLGLFIAVPSAVLLNWLIEGLQKRKVNRAEKVLGEFVDMTGCIVQAKLNRIRETLQTAKQGDKFKQFVKPGAQLTDLFKEAAEFIEDLYGIPTEKIDITVFERRPHEHWECPLVFQTNWKRPTPEEILVEGSTGSKCLDGGGAEFHASKVQASEKGLYRLGARDDELGDGSIYCKFLQFQTPQGNFEYLIHIITFGERLCPPWDEALLQPTIDLCNEIARRIELELSLRVITTIK